MSKIVLCNYIFYLIFCGEFECIYSRCKNGEISCEMKWYEGGLLVIWLLIFVFDLKRFGSFMKFEDLLCIDNSEYRMMLLFSVKLKVVVKINSK